MCEWGRERFVENLFFGNFFVLFVGSSCGGSRLSFIVFLRRLVSWWCEG